MSLRSQRSGRRDGTERVRELVALIGSLCKTGDSISIDAISSRLGLKLEDAKAMMDIICSASGEETGGLLISSNGDETEFTLQYPGVHGKPIRLTRAETMALFYALDIAGVGDDNPLRQQIDAAFAAPAINEDEVRQALGKARSNKALLLCARSLVTEHIVSFSYQGVKDTVARRRNAAVRELVPEQQTWLVRAYDTDLHQERTFRLDRMNEVSLGHYFERPRKQRMDVQMVEIVFKDPAYYTLFDWPGLEITRRQRGVLRGRIPYYGHGTTWLIRRIIACGGGVIVNDTSIMEQARQYARGILSQELSQN